MMMQHAKTEPRPLLRGVAIREGVRRLHIVPVLIGFLFYVVGAVWVWASPIVATSDDDYHLTSTWCPRPFESSGCEYRLRQTPKPTNVWGHLSDVEVKVPSILRDAGCKNFKTDVSAACMNNLSEKSYFFSDRVDDGGYPYGFYHINHLFVTSHVITSILVMRLFNWTLIYALCVGVMICAPVAYRRPIILTALFTAIPMGTYYIASNNPSSWAIGGLFIFATATVSALHSAGKRRCILMAIALVGALLCTMARADASFFIWITSLAIWISQPWKREYRNIAILTAVVSVWGLIVYASLDKNFILAVNEPDADKSIFIILLRNIFNLPSIIAGFYGLAPYHPGMSDAPLHLNSYVFSYATLGMMLAIGATAYSLRKFLSTGLLFGATVGMPVLVMTMKKMASLQPFQPRYVMPLFIVCVFLHLLPTEKREIDLKRSQWLFAGVCIFFIQHLAVEFVVMRYVRGNKNLGFSLNKGVEWWWTNFPLSPNGLWLLSSVSCVILLCLLTPYVCNSKKGKVAGQGTSSSMVEHEQEIHSDRKTRGDFIVEQSVTDTQNKEEIQQQKVKYSTVGSQ